MYKNKCKDGSLNRSGRNIADLRKAMVPRVSQKGLAEKMQLAGIDMDKNAIQKIECGKRFITDIELVIFAKVLKVELEILTSEPV